ncbi:ubiquitin-associated domain-containing protein 1 isoform X1 [Schistocerca nitens]|uniref:ubiquitin-associated domain-containing protein 1 isoform X1 n=1 Tax=Schistocerca nitens TaxID=7011 RepID=UPI002117E991|nr:ubiquitin-associated domain-containing protein 1 isoform X1 [Schistocerca nitens]
MLPWVQEKISGGRQRLMSIFSRRLDSDIRLSSQNKETMFVSEGNALCGEMIEVTVISPEGDKLTVDAAADCTVDKLKTMAVSRFYNSTDLSKVAQNYKLVSVSGRKPLNDNNAINQEDIKTNDQVLLMKRRRPPVKEQISVDNLKAPTVEEIQEATSKLDTKNTTKEQPQLGCSLDFESDIRKVLISLVEASARILTPSPESEEVFQIIRERLENKGVDHIVKQLTDMGFPQALVVEALHLNSMNPRLALDWLLKHSTVRPGGLCDDTSNDELTCTNCAEEAAVSTYTAAAAEASRRDKKSVIQSVASLLESFRSYRRQYFKPNPKALGKLKEMGFKEEDIIDALQVTGNHETSACEWLLGERRRSLEDLDTGLDPDGPVYKAIMANPAIQLSLTNPKMLLAFLSMLENPSNTNVWINDPDAAPVLSQIFKTYHTEKHVLQPTDVPQ